MKKDIRIKITNEEGSVKQSSSHEIFLEAKFSEFDPAIKELVDEAVKKFKASGELVDEIQITESYYYC